jgi:alpha-L-fucosidase 2
MIKSRNTAGNWILKKQYLLVSYQNNGHVVRQEAFVSHPHQVIVLRYSTEAPEGLSGRIRLTRPEDEGVPTVLVEAPAKDLLIMRGAVTQRKGQFRSQPAPILEGVQFETRLKIRHEGGNLQKGEDDIELQGVQEATFLIVSNSSFYHDNYSEKNEEQLEVLAELSVAELRRAHIEDHQSLYNRLELQLAENDLDSLPTDIRLARIREGLPDPHLEQVLFQYGRYLLIGSSRPGTKPANLQGLWNPHINAPWNADYHLNINLQMNYWLANSTGLGELNQPLFDYIDRLVENGRQTAQKNFGCRGSFIPHATDLWAPTWLRAPTAYWGCSVGAGGWLMQHYWEHFAFTGDTCSCANESTLHSAKSLNSTATGSSKIPETATWYRLHPPLRKTAFTMKKANQWLAVWAVRWISRSLRKYFGIICRHASC